MSNGLEVCPHCGHNLLKGAMRCTGCGKILKTTEDQISSIKDYMETHKRRSGARKFIKPVIFLLAAGIIYYFFSDKIYEVVTGVLNRLGK